MPHFNEQQSNQSRGGGIAQPGGFKGGGISQPGRFSGNDELFASLNSQQGLANRGIPGVQQSFNRQANPNQRPKGGNIQQPPAFRPGGPPAPGRLR